MTLARRLQLRGRFTPPYSAPSGYVIGGAYDPGIAHGTRVLTQLHCHTTGSDGSYTPAQVVADYLGAGYGALAITDHDVVTSQPAGITTAITANELSPNENHILSWNASYTRGTATNAQTLVDNVVAAGGQAAVAHPVWYRGMTYDEMANLIGYLGLEIHNQKCVNGAGQNPVTYPGFALDRWDALLSGSRRDIWGLATDDLHNIDAFNAYDVGRVQVFAADNTVSSIMAAIEVGNFAADVSNHGVTPGYPTRDADSLSLTCVGATKIEAWGRDGLLTSSTGTSHTHTFDGSEYYVRLVAVGDYTEPFATLSDRWYAVDGTWSATAGVLTHTDSSTSQRRIVLRRHREGDYTAQVDVSMTGTGIALMFNVLNTSYYYILRLGRTGSPTGYVNTLAVAKTTSGSFGTPLATYAITPSTSTFYTIKMAYTAATGRIQAKVWLRDDPEPGSWQIDVSDTSWKHGMFGLRADGAPSFDNFYVDGFRTYYQPISIDPA